MAVVVIFRLHREQKPNTGVQAVPPVFLALAVSSFPHHEPATTAQMSCLQDVAAYQRTSEIIAFPTCSCETCLVTWWSSLKTSTDPGPNSSQFIHLQDFGNLGFFFFSFPVIKNGEDYLNTQKKNQLCLKMFQNHITFNTCSLYVSFAHFTISDVFFYIYISYI